MVSLAIQLETLGAVDEPIAATLRRIGETSYGGVEFGGLGSASPSEIARVLDETALSVAGAHVGIDDLEDAYDETVDTYRTLGSPRLVVSEYPAEAFQTREGVDEAARRLSSLARRLHDDGLELAYHSNDYEFGTVGPGSAFDRFTEQSTDLLQIEFDTGLAKRAGRDPSELIRTFADRTALVQLTDTRTNSERTLHVELGGGEVDLQACLDAARAANVEWAIYEHGQTTDPLASLDHSDAALSSLLSD